MDTSCLQEFVRCRPGGRADHYQGICPARRLDQADQLRDRADLELRHYAGPMHLYRLLSRTELRRNLLIEQTANQASRDFLLPRRQPIDSFEEDMVKASFGISALALLQSTVHRANQQLGVHRPGQEIDGTAFHGPDDRCDIPSAGHEDNRQSAVVEEFPLQVQSRDAWQVVVENHTGWRVKGPARQDRFCRAEPAHREPGGRQALTQCRAGARIVFDHEDVLGRHRVLERRLR